MYIKLIKKFCTESVPRTLLSWLNYENTLLVLIAGVLGITCGLLSVLFDWLYEICRKAFFAIPSGYFGEETNLYHYILIPLTPAIGGLIIGVLTWRFKMGEESSSAAEVMKWAAVDGGKVKTRTVWFRTLATSIFLGSGGSGGKEGPIAQICGAMGSAFGQMLKVSSDRLRLLVGCGAAAGIAAAFNAPIAGVIFTVELVLADFNVVSFLPIVIASVMATTTKRLFLGDVPAFEAPSYSLVSHWEIGFYFILGILCGLVAKVFFMAYFKAEDVFKDKVKVHPVLKPAIGGFLVGIIGVFFPQFFGGGYVFMNQMLNGDMIWTLALTLVAVKIVSTSISLGSGGSGGIFAPSLFIGCMTGGVFGYIINSIDPAHTASVGAYAMVGVGAVMAAVAHAPLTNILMGYELTGNYQIILPIMTACIMSTFVMTIFNKRSLYTEKLHRRGIDILHGRDMAVMDRISVDSVMRKGATTIPENLPFGKIMLLMTSSHDNYFPVVDVDSKLVGIISIQNIREIMLDSAELCDLVVAKEIATEDVITLKANDNLNVAMAKFGIKDLEQLPVVSNDDSLRVIGMITRMDVISAYKKAVIGVGTQEK